MKIAIIQFPGSNCERETALAVKRAGMTPVDFLWNESPSELAKMDGFILVGGFSYEDRSRAGIIAALDPILDTIKSQSELGKPVLGICNGAQILVESGMVPGLKNYQLGMALTENRRLEDGKILGTGFYNNWITMRLCDNPKPNAFTRHFNKESLLTIPAAHAQGRFVIPAPLLEEMVQEGMTLFQYCDETGLINPDFPVNPNGSIDNIAAVINATGNVMAIMPHPERCSAGDSIFTSMRDYILDSRPYKPRVLSFSPSITPISPYIIPKKSRELLVNLVITDNAALSVQHTLQQAGIPVTVMRMEHWQVDGSDEKSMEDIANSGLLYNERKEYCMTSEAINRVDTVAFLVRTKDNLVGRHTLQSLQDYGFVPGVEAIHHGILWIFKSEKGMIHTLKDAILNTHIIANAYADEVYTYE